MAALGVVAVAGFGLLRERGLLGSPHGEVYGHAWHVDWHAEALPAWAMGTDAAVGTQVWPVLDPIPMAVASVLTRLGTLELGYDAWILASVLLAFAGGAALGRAVDGSPLVGALALSLSPAFVGSVASGLTEDSAVGLVALAYGALIARRFAVGGLLLGATAWCGPVLAVYAAFGAIALALPTVVRDRTQLRGYAVAAAIAGGLALPAAWLQRPMLGSATSRDEVTTCAAAWQQNPWGGADLLSFVTPGRIPWTEGLFHPGYVGLTVLALAVSGGRRHALVRVAVYGALLALGFTICGAGHGLAPNPIARLVALLPLAGVLHDHARGMLIVAVALAGLAARGATQLRRPGWAAVVVAADLLALSPTSYPLPVAGSDPAAISEGLGELHAGAVFVVPTSGPGINFLRPLIDQRAHGRRVLLDPDRPGAIAPIRLTPLGRWLDGLARPGVSPRRPEVLDLPPMVAVLVVMEPYVARVEALLGAPDARASDGAAWDFERRRER